LQPKGNDSKYDIVTNNEDAECTFTPQINKLQKKHTNGSHVYLNTNAFERLSRPRTPPGSKPEGEKPLPKRPSSAASKVRVNNSVSSKILVLTI